MKKSNTKMLVFTALFAAIIAVCTRFTAVPIPGIGGYIHIGDAFVFLSAALLPLPYAIAASAIGGALADFMYQALIYVIPTAIIKSLMVLAFFGKTEKKLFCKKSIVGVLLGTIILCGGYYLAEAVIFSSFVSPLAGIPRNLIQGVFSSISFLLFAAALDAARVGERLGI